MSSLCYYYPPVIFLQVQLFRKEVASDYLLEYAMYLHVFEVMRIELYAKSKYSLNQRVPH